MPRRRVSKPRKKRMVTYVPSEIYRLVDRIRRLEGQDLTMSDLLYKWILEKLSPEKTDPRIGQDPGSEPEEGSRGPNKELLQMPFSALTESQTGG